jgi:hypothetical protein
MAYIALLAALAVLIGAVRYGPRRRHAVMARCAKERHLRFSPRDAIDVPRRLAACVLMSVGHSHRAWCTLDGRRGTRAWFGCVEGFDLACGGDRASVRRCVAAIQCPTDDRLLLIPRAVADDARHPLQTALERHELRALAADSRSTTHTLFSARRTAGRSHMAERLGDAIRCYPADWSWESGHGLLVVVADDTDAADRMGTLLDAVAAVADDVAPAPPLPTEHAKAVTME